MKIADIIPKGGLPQRIYCAECKAHTELAYTDFNEVVSDVAIKISGLPVLRCPKCGHDQLPDNSRVAIVKLHDQAAGQAKSSISVNRRKCDDRFDFSDVQFMYDSDDYFYIPGLYRSFDIGFLQPVFFKLPVLLKYDNAPGYRVKFASTTYGTIETDDCQIPFGINRHGHVVMWLGDIGKLPVDEQHYLRSENVASDHSLGSEFYDGQIECIFTPRTREDELFRLRSEFMTAFQVHFGQALGHLESEALDLALSFNPPVIDTDKERRHVADVLNKLYLEALDNRVLERIATSLSLKPAGTGTLKRLQAILECLAPTGDIATTMSPLYVLYDFRVAGSHLTSKKTLMKAVLTRLGLSPGATLQEIYHALVMGLQNCFTRMTDILKV